MSKNPARALVGQGTLARSGSHFPKKVAGRSRKAPCAKNALPSGGGKESSVLRSVDSFARFAKGCSQEGKKGGS